MPRKRTTALQQGQDRRCLRPGCPRKLYSRGLCAACYQSAHDLVRTGRTTWKQLEATGRARRPATGPRTWLLGKDA